ncbi:MAG: Oligoendopeptidase F, plasmid [Chlamydiae bacterium]|nr:Oligoendopeptidase F, plasmid [Chlamydiota bacterium]
MTTWNLKRFYPSFQAWVKDFVSLEKRIKKEPLKAFVKAKTTTAFFKLLKTFFTLSQHLEKVYTYIHLVHDLDLANTSAKTQYKKILQLVQDFENQSAFISPLLIKQKTPLLKALQKRYPQFITKLLRQKKHTLSEKEEQILASSSLMAAVPSQTFSVLNNVDFDFGFVLDKNKKKKRLTHGSYLAFLKNPDRTLRKHAFCALHNTFKSMQNTLTELLSGHVQTHLFHSKTKHFSSPLDAALFDKKIDTSVYYNLIKSVQKALPSLHTFLKLKRDLLSLKSMHLYDVYLPLYSNKKRYDYKDAKTCVLEAIKPLGKDYHRILQQGLNQWDWVDVYEKKHKRSGAYSSGCYDSDPYILLNYTHTLYDVFVLAHEGGHSMHSYLSKYTQPFDEASYPIFLAEIASITNEELLFAHLLKQAKTDKEKAALLAMRLDDVRATLFRQTMFAEFELWMHETIEATPLTSQLLCQKYYALNKAYFGSGVNVDQEIEIEWARIPHFYFNFYVFNYATSYCIAQTFAKQILAGNEKAKKGYLTLLKSGGSKFPIDLLKELGLDLTTSKVFDTALKDFAKKTKELKTLLHKK